MDISSLLGNRLSLVDYMGQGNRNSNNVLGSRGGKRQSVIESVYAAKNQENAAYVLDLSPEAQRMLEQQNQQTATASQPIQGAQKHFLSFFEDAGLDFDNLPASAVELLEGILTMFSESGATGRDSSTDSLELKVSNGERDVYTLTGQSRRTRVAIEQQDNGQKMLSISDIHGDTANIAEISISTVEDNATYLNVEYFEKTFANGRTVNTEQSEPLNIKLS